MNEKTKMFFAGMWFMLALVSLHTFQFGFVYQDILRTILAMGVFTFLIYFIQLGEKTR